MIPKISRSVLLFGLFLALGAVAPASAQSPITWNFKKGAVLKYDFAQKNEIKLTIAGEDRATTSELGLELTWTVDDVKDGTAIVTQTVDRAKVSVGIPAGPINYDSSSKMNDENAREIAKIYDQVIGEKYTLTIDNRGELRDVKVPAKVEEAIKSSPFAAVADGGSVLSPKGLIAMMSQVLPKLDKAPIAKGGTWKGSLELPSGPLRLKLDSDYTLTDATKDKLTIDSKITTGVTAGPPLTVELKKQTGNAKYEIDLSKGVVSSSSIKHSFDMLLKANGQEISQTIAIEASMKLKP